MVKVGNNDFIKSVGYDTGKNSLSGLQSHSYCSPSERIICTREGIYSNVTVTSTEEKFQGVVEHDGNGHEQGRIKLTHKLLNTVKLIGIKTSGRLYKAQSNVLRSEAAVSESMKNPKWHARPETL